MQVHWAAGRLGAKSLTSRTGPEVMTHAALHLWLHIRQTITSPRYLWKLKMPWSRLESSKFKLVAGLELP